MRCLYCGREGDKAVCKNCAGFVYLRYRGLTECPECCKEFEVGRVRTEDAVNELAKIIHRTAVRRGWWRGERRPIKAKDNPLSVAVKLALIMTEAAEAMQKAREGGDNEEIAEEVIDGIIRGFDLCKALGVNPGKILVKKMVYNSRRPYRHGKLF